MTLSHIAPMPFNPKADANAAARYGAVTASMVADQFYDSHTREECKAEWAARYDRLLNTTIPFLSAQAVHMQSVPNTLADWKDWALAQGTIDPVVREEIEEDCMEMDDGA